MNLRMNNSYAHTLYSKGLVTNYVEGGGGRLQNGRRGGGRKSFRYAEGGGGHKTFWGSVYSVA